MKAKILARLESQLKAQGKSPEAAARIARASLQRAGMLKSGSDTPTAAGIARGNMSAKERAVDRASKQSGHRPSDYSYSSKTNRATLRG